MTDNTESNYLETPESFREKLEQINQGGEHEEVQQSGRDESGEAGQEASEREQEQGERREGQEDQPENPESNADSLDEEAIDTPDKGKMVPLGRFNEINGKYQETREQMIRLEERLNQYDRAMQLAQQEQQQETQPQQAENPFDPELEPEQHRIYELEQRLNSYDNKFQELEGKDQQFEQQTQLNHLKQTAQQQLVNSQIPDMKDAYEYLEQAKMKEFAPFVQTEQQLYGMVDQYMVNLASAAMRSGKGVDQLVYDMAQSINYQPKPKDADKSGPNLDKIQENASKTASNSGGGSASAGMGSGVGSFKETLHKTKSGKPRGVDPAKFHKHLEKIQQG